MKRIAILTCALAIAGCADMNQQQTPPAPPIVQPTTAAAAEPPPVTGADILAKEPVEVQGAIRDHTPGDPWPTFKAHGRELVPYAFDMAPPTITGAPHRTVDIQLEPGETITDVAVGDKELFAASPASSGDPTHPVAHVSIKCAIPGTASSLTIYTVKRDYRIDLRCAAHEPVWQLVFYYPDDIRAEMRAADEAAAKTPVEAAKDSKPKDSGTQYRIEGAHAAWRPTRVWDDGTHVYMEMPPAMKTADAPALMLKQGGGEQMVNYRRSGDSIIVDRLFDKAMLVSGVGSDRDAVTITRVEAKQ